MCSASSRSCSCSVFLMKGVRFTNRSVGSHTHLGCELETKVEFFINKNMFSPDNLVDGVFSFGIFS